MTAELSRLTVLVLLAGLMLGGCRRGDCKSPKMKGDATIVTAKKPTRVKRKKRVYPYRSPAQNRRFGNHLKGEKSLYLQQHAKNPIEWYPWGKAALQRAKDEDKPIFLSIGYSACHWCHVMEKKVFIKDDIAEYMNRHFICIKVDREERPDLDSIYMDAVHALRKRGGWPMSVFLTPTLKPFFGATYIPNARFKRLIRRLKDQFQNNRQEVETKAAEIQKKVSRQLGPSDAFGNLNDGPLKSAVLMTRRRFDSEWGGMRQRIKFPVPVRWHFLLRRYRKTGNPELAGMLKKTLDMMARGGIYDQIGGGFHRYSTDRKWRVPHFEKMLYDNGQLADLYLEAGVVFKNPEYTRIARGTLDYLLREMYDKKNGGFYSSLDADSDDEEGWFYVWSKAEIMKVAGKRDGPPLVMLLGISETGDIKHKSVLTRNEAISRVAETHKLTKQQVAGLFTTYAPKLLALRARRNRPGLDKKILASWNGLVLVPLARAYRLLKHKPYLIAAEKSAAYLWRAHHRGGGRLYRASFDGSGKHEGMLNDYTFLANGLVELYLATNKTLYLKRALLLTEYARKHFVRGNGGGWFMTPEHHVTPLRRSFSPWDSVLPSGPASMLTLLYKLSVLTGNELYREEVEITLRSYGRLLRRGGSSVSEWLSVLQNFLGPYYEVVIVGDRLNATTKALVDVFAKRFPTHALLLTVGKGADARLAKLLPVTKGKTIRFGKPTAYVCRFGSCKKPTSDVSEFSRQLLSGWKL